MGLVVDADAVFGQATQVESRSVGPLLDLSWCPTSPLSSHEPLENAIDDKTVDQVHCQKVRDDLPRVTFITSRWSFCCGV